jgi:hypothetical protein
MTQFQKGVIPQNASQQTDVEQIARLMRYSRDGSLSDKSRDVIKGYILGQLGVGELQEIKSDLKQPSYPNPSESVEQNLPLGLQSKPTPPPAKQVPVEKENRSPHGTYFQFELKVRHLVEADSAWDVIEPFVLEMIRLQDDEQTVAKAAELAFLRASQKELERFFSDLRSRLTKAWLHMHTAVRAHLVVRFWRSGSSNILAPVVYKHKDHADLQPIERLYILHSLTASKDSSLPWIYFKQFREDIEGAVRNLGTYVDMDENRFYLEIGKVAVDLGFEKDGRALFEKISPASNEHEEALQLILHANIDQTKSRKSHYTELLLSHGDPMERLRLFAGFFDSTRGLGGFRDRNRPALNELLVNPVEWLQSKPDVLRRLSEILLANRDLEPLLPNIFNFFKEQALKFQSKENELAIWSGCAEIRPTTSADFYWQAVGYLHIYANTGPGNEVLIWRARRLIAKSKENAANATIYDWRVLHKTVYSWVAKSPFLVEAERTKMLAQLRIAVASEFLVLGDISDYLDANETINLEVSDSLIKVCQEKKAIEVELKILVKRAFSSHFTNSQLNRVWQIAGLTGNHDLAWRTASVLNSRGVLHASVRHPWEISGEKRSTYPINNINKKAVAICTRGLPPTAQKIAWALVHIGHLLPELLSCLDRGASTARSSGYPSDSIERKADDTLNALGWLPPLKKRYKFSFDATTGLSKVPAFAQVLPANLWSVLVAHLSERLGVNAFQWKLSSLHDQVTDLIPRMAGRQDMRRHSSKVASWLKDLSPEQRSAWHDLASLSRTLDDETARDALAIFITRLATLIYQNHVVALQSLQAMRANVQIFWMLESWVLSQEYQLVRKALGYESRVPVPNLLLKMDSVLLK